MIQKAVYRPWGSYTVLYRQLKYQVKIITIKPKCRISLQWHHYRAENWVVVKGTAFVTIGEQDLELKVGDKIHVPQKVQHRIANPTSNETLEIVEVQIGDYIEEDDIVRVEDDFGRADKT